MEITQGKKICAFLITSLMVVSTMFIAPLVTSQSDLNDVLLSGMVHNIDTDEYFTDIQSAINDPDTLNGHTLFVSNGTYLEHVVINKQLTLIGEDPLNTTIDAGGTGDTILVTANFVSISGFTITGAGNYAGTDRDAGIELYENTNCQIFDNRVINNALIGVLLEGSSDLSNNNNIERNNLSLNQYGVYLHNSGNNIISQNYIFDCSRGLYHTGGTGNDIIGNTFDWNSYGILLSQAKYNDIEENNFIENWYAIYMQSDINNVNNEIYHNNFIDSDVPSVDEVANYWDDGYPSGGNYWSDYGGIDSNSDGIGDTPYTNIDGGAGAQDNYPLMAPYGPSVDLSIVDEDITFSNPNPSQWENITISAEIFNEKQDIVTFDIPISGLDWNFISFPVDVSGNIETVLDDSMNGDGGTTWDVAKWYNPADANDPWKTYRVGASTNDLITINITMGIWIRITDNGGDGNLTVKGRMPPMGHTPLWTGWNMVGFPATESTNMTAGDVRALTGYNVTDILTYSGNYTILPWENYTTLNDTDYLTRGKAYWFNVSENCSWTVDNGLPEIPDANAIISFYLDSISEANLIDRQFDVQVPEYGSTIVTANWTINVTGSHTIIVDVTDVNPTDSNMLNNTAQKDIMIVTTSIFNINLSPGWNLISLPLIQSNESLESVLSSIDGKWDKIMTYDPLSPNLWSSTATYKPDSLNEIDLLDHKTGFWIHMLPPETVSQTYTYENVSQSTNDHFAWFLDVDEASDSEFKNPNSQTEFANFRYTQIVSSDDVRASSLNPGEDDEIFTMSSFNISENPAEINKINMTMEIQGNMATEFQVWVFNVMADTWVPLGTSTWTPADTDIVLERAIETNCADYISGDGRFSWGCYQTNSSELVRVDYMGIEIHSSTIENTILTVTGTIPESTDIPLYAGWNLVSYPSLNDTMIVSLAFFGTGADRVEICDPAEPYLIKEVGPTYVMQPGEGYWVHVPADTVWTVDW